MRYIILLTILLTLTIPATAQDANYEILNDQRDITYGGDEITAEVDCTGSDCPTGGFASIIELSMCGEKAGQHSIPAYRSRSFPVDITFTVPGDAPCSLGQHTAFIEGQEAGTYNVIHKGDMDPNKGKYLAVQLSEINSGSHSVFDFFLTDDNSDPIGTDIPSPGIQLRENNIIRDWEAWATPQEEIISPGQSLEQITGECPVEDGQDSVCEIANDVSLADDYNNKFGKSDYLRKLDTATPLHGDGGSYQLQGELIYGEQIGTNETYFFICRPDKEGVPQQTDTVVINTASEHDSFVCKRDSTSGEWVNASDNIRVDFFTTNATGYVGFEITHNELQEWQNTYGHNPFINDGTTGKLVIKGECWQGLEGQRPGDDSEISKFTRTVEERGRTIVATTVPERTEWSDAEKSRGVTTFSCNFGFQQEWYPDNTFNTFIDPFYENNGNQYIVQGSQNIDPISVSFGDANLPDQSVLEEAASKTRVDNTPFENFPAGGIGSDNQLKDPYEVWFAQYGN